jgi:tellurite resistance protein TerC
MFEHTVITPWHWAGFILVILLFLALDLGVFHRQAHVVRFREALGWTTLWFCMAMGFAGALVPMLGSEKALEFLTGYIIELSLSMDNVFVIALIFAFFAVPREYQHRVLFWGILGALVMRGVMIGVGAALVAEFEWLLYLMGAFLVFTGIRMVFADDEEIDPEKNPIIRLVRRLYPVTTTFDGQNFTTRINGRVALTPLALVLMMVETTDLVFAVDSIPAIFAITQDPFIIFTSNVFAILGLRSLYFVLAGAISYFRFLKVGLSIVLVYIGVKMLLLMWGVHIPTLLSLGVVAGILVTAVAMSVFVQWHDRRHPPATGPSPLREPGSEVR